MDSTQLYSPLHFDDFYIHPAVKLFDSCITLAKFGEIRVDPGLDMFNATSEQLVNVFRKIVCPIGFGNGEACLIFWPRQADLAKSRLFT